MHYTEEEEADLLQQKRSHRETKSGLNDLTLSGFLPDIGPRSRHRVAISNQKSKINPALLWEKVPVPVVTNNNTDLGVLKDTNKNFERCLDFRNGLSSGDNISHRDELSEPTLVNPDHHKVLKSHQHYHQQQNMQQQKVIKVPMTMIEASSGSSKTRADDSLPTVNATVIHSYEVVRTALVKPGSPCGPYTSQVFAVEESDLRDFDPFARLDSILAEFGHTGASHFSSADCAQSTEISSSDDFNNNGAEEYQEQLSCPLQQSECHQHLPQRDFSSQPYRPQNPLSPSKSSVGDSKMSPLVRKPSIRRKSNPLAAFLATGTKDVKKSSKGKSGGTMGLPSGLKFRERGSSLTRYPADIKSRTDNTGAVPLSDAWMEYIENSYEKFDVVLRKESGGYGIQLHGQYPVIVDSVRPGGGASKNGIMKGDIIFKINGNLVVKHSHEMVIKCFQNAGPFMGLTLLRAPSNGGDDESKQNNLTSLFAQNDKISKPAPAARDKNLELEKERLITLKSMYDKAVRELEHLKVEVQRNPCDTMVMKCDNQARVVAQLEKSISNFSLSSISQQIPFEQGHSNNSLPKLAMPYDSGAGNGSIGFSHYSSSSSTDIVSMEGFDCGADDDTESCAQYKEFEDLNLLVESPAHLSCFLKYLIHNSEPNYMVFKVVSFCYSQSSFKELHQCSRWAHEIFLTFMFDTSPLYIDLPANIVKLVENAITNGKEYVLRNAFQPALVFIQDTLVKQLEEFQHRRTLGLGNFFGEEFLPKPKINVTASSSFTAPVSFHSSPKPPLSISHLNSSSYASGTGMAAPSATSRGNNLSSASFTASSKSSASGNSDPYAVEKILWDIFLSYHQQDEEVYWNADEVKPAMAASLATFFRHPGVLLSKQNQIILETVPSFMWRDKKALKSKLKGHMVVNGHNFTPYQCPLVTRMNCTLCLRVLWGAGHQGYKCSYCDMAAHRICTKQNIPTCHKVPSKQKSGRDETTSTFYTAEPHTKCSFNSLPHRKKKKGHFLDDIMLSDSETLNAPDVDSKYSSATPGGSNTPFIFSQFGPSLTPSTPIEPPDSDMEVEQDLPPLSKVIPEEILVGLVGPARKKQEIINELFFTERSHVKSLLIMIHCYLRPMRNDPKIDQNFVEVIFPHVEAIAEWHRELSNDFKARRKEQPVVQEVGDILLKRFSGETALSLQEKCAEFCRNQLVNLEQLKIKQKQDAYLNQFIMNTAQKEICKKQDLKDCLPKVMQRLTKYPLLFDNLLKVTPAGTEEHARLLRALKNVRLILDHVNETARESEHQRILLDVKKRIDAKPLENVNHPVLAEFKNLQAELTNRKLCHYGHLTWNASASKNIGLFLTLFEDLLVIFQTQDNKLVLKCETAGAGADASKYVFAPILKLGNLMVKDAPRTTRTFYLVNASKEASQMYTLTAKARDEREEWMKQIRNTIENYKKKLSSSIVDLKPSVLTETSPCYETVEAAETSNIESERVEEQGAVDVVDGVKEEADDDELSNSDQSHNVYNPEKELKRQIIAANELMMDKVKALSEMHHIEPPSFDLSEKTLHLSTDSEDFIAAIAGSIDVLTNFFTSLPDVAMVSAECSSLEWDPIESIFELGQRLQILVSQLECLVLEKYSGNAGPRLAPSDNPPPVPTTEPPPLEYETRDNNGRNISNYAETSF